MFLYMIRFSTTSAVCAVVLMCPIKLFDSWFAASSAVPVLLPLFLFRKHCWKRAANSSSSVEATRLLANE